MAQEATVRPAECSVLENWGYRVTPDPQGPVLWTAFQTDGGVDEKTAYVYQEIVIYENSASASAAFADLAEAAQICTDWEVTRDNPESVVDILGETSTYDEPGTFTVDRGDGFLEQTSVDGTVFGGAALVGDRIVETGFYRYDDSPTATEIDAVLALQRQLIASATGT